MAQDYDAFLSYSSSDRAQVRRIHRFLESYRDRTLGRRLRVYFDQTDIRGGELGGELQQALRASRTLIACYSPAAADSRWVNEEITAYRRQHGDARITIALLRGDAPARFDALGTTDCRHHDLRRGWYWRWLRPFARLELLRLLAFIADVELRRLRNWHFRRTLRNVALATLIAIGLPALILSIPMERWTALELKSGNQPLYPIAAEVQESKLWVAWRIRAPGHLYGVRDQYYQNHDALNPTVRGGNIKMFRLQRRALPVTLTRDRPSAELRNVDLGTVASIQHRNRVGVPYFAALAGKGELLLQPLSATEDEEQALADSRPDPAESDGRLDAKSKPRRALTTTAVAVTKIGADIRAAEVPGLILDWQPNEATGLLTSPAAGVALLWLDDGRIWLGAQGVDAGAEGGLWHSLDGGRTWQRVRHGASGQDTERFRSVSSLSLRTDSAGQQWLVVAEQHFNRWDRAILRPHPSRVLERGLKETAEWRPASMPPFGSRSQIELCGEINGTQIVRVDERIFRRGTVPLWRLLVPNATNAGKDGG